MWLTILFSVYLQAILSMTVLGYKIDESCADKNIEDTVREAMQSAFQMADAAIARLSTVPLAPDTMELLGFLFAKPNASPAQLLENGKLSKTLRVLQNINTYMRNEVTGDTAVDAEDVIIFCHYERLELIDGRKKVWRDTSNGLEVKFDEQLCRGTVMDKIALAMTANPDMENPVEKNGVRMDTRRPTQIQLCPWFIDWIKEKKFKLFNDVQKRTTIGRAVIRLAEWNQLGLTQIDAFSLLDKVLLHEMTHGRGAYTVSEGEGVTEGLVDVPSTNRFLSMFNWAAYGWNGATGLASKGADLGGKDAPDNNADTVALFASVCKLMNDPNNPRKVDVKGRIVPRPLPR